MKNGRVLFVAMPVLLGVLACATASGPAAIPPGTDQGNRSLGASSYTPFSGVVCDREGGWCADAWGISMGLTKEYLGAPAEAALMQRFKANPDLVKTQFTLSNGASCDTEKRTCTNKYTHQVDQNTTKALFR